MNEVQTMRTLIAVSLLFVSLGWSASSDARDDRLQFPVSDVLNNEAWASDLEGVSFYFGEQAHPPVVKTFGTDRTNKKTNAFNKSDEEACQWVMLTALKQLKARADQLGANAVINIISNYKNNQKSSETEYTCGAGSLMAGVALIGEFVVIE